MTKHDHALSNIFHALSDPTRRAILAHLGQGPASLGDLARPTGFSLPTVHKHVQILEQAQLISWHKSGRTRMCQTRPDTLTVTADWLLHTRAKMAAQADRLENYAQSLKEVS
jgi:DNA-binding transcriptional ArsR family regulator